MIQIILDLYPWVLGLGGLLALIGIGFLLAYFSNNEIVVNIGTVCIALGFALILISPFALLIAVVFFYP